METLRELAGFAALLLFAVVFLASAAADLDTLLSKR